ncbi:MAG: thioredoxin family protein [Gammaproteobacteria bacterium]
MRTVATVLLAISLFAPIAHADQPYDESANALADIKQALKAASAEKKNVIAIFGANWCPYCRALAKALAGEAGRKLEQKFVIVKVNVGQFDTNMDLVQSYGNPLGDGLPGAAVIGADDKTLFIAKADELVNAVDKGDDGLSELFGKGVK